MSQILKSALDLNSQTRTSNQTTRTINEQYCPDLHQWNQRHYDHQFMKKYGVVKRDKLFLTSTVLKTYYNLCFYQTINYS